MDGSVCTEKKFPCPVCKKEFTRFFNLQRHVKRSHITELDTLNETYKSKKKCNFSCEECSRSFNKKYLLFHKRKVHSAPREVTTCYKCPLCFETLSKNLHLSHLESEHNIKIETENHTFSSLEEFSNWKQKVEHEAKCKFIAERGSTGVQVKYHFYRCHRSGYFTSESQGLRHLKTQGSNKINSLCPASIRIIEKPDGICQVKYIKTHVGHQVQLGHLSLSNVERQSLAEKLAQKIPFDKILDDVRESLTEEGRKRLHLLTKKDLHNIENCYGINSDVVRDKNDAISVDAWVREMMCGSESCVIFYKPQEMDVDDYPDLKHDDFALMIMNNAQKSLLNKYGSESICVDSTHGLNDYGFELTTLLVLDDMHEGFPCAFLMSNRTDEEIMSIFFKCIKEKVGIIQPNVFMSDMAESFVNAWCKVMSKPKLHLYCTWHVDRAWRKNLNKIKIKDKQVEVYKLLRTLLEERDKQAFEMMLNEAIGKLCSDPETIVFGSYFRQHYAKCASAWAFCYRLHCGLNTNMHLERMHKTIKYIYLNGKNVKRLDKSLHAIMRFVRDKMIERLITLDKGKISTKLKDLRNRHKTSLSSSFEATNTGKGWNVASATSNEIYFIEKNANECSCRLICTECKACIHRYTCTCPDSAIKWNMCKHIHFICKLEHPNEEENSEVQINETILENELHMDIADDETDILEAELSKSKVATKPIMDSEIENLKKEYSELLNSITSKKELEIMKKILMQAKSTLSAQKSSCKLPCLDAVPGNKKIEPQRRLFATRKMKKTSKKSIVKPTCTEKNSIALSLILSQKENGK